MPCMIVTMIVCSWNFMNLKTESFFWVIFGGFPTVPDLLIVDIRMDRWCRMWTSFCLSHSLLPFVSCRKWLDLSGPMKFAESMKSYLRIRKQSIWKLTSFWAFSLWDFRAVWMYWIFLRAVRDFQTVIFEMESERWMAPWGTYLENLKVLPAQQALKRLTEDLRVNTTWQNITASLRCLPLRAHDARFFLLLWQICQMKVDGFFVGRNWHANG